MVGCSFQFNDEHQSISGFGNRSKFVETLILVFGDVKVLIVCKKTKLCVFKSPSQSKVYLTSFCVQNFKLAYFKVDDAFLLVHAWRKHSRLNTNPVKIMEIVVSEAGPSITVSFKLL